jgi:hypothetical protein
MQNRKSNTQHRPRHASSGTSTSLNLHLGQAVLPDSDVGSDTVLAIVKENNPADVSL